MKLKTYLISIGVSLLILSCSSTISLPILDKYLNSSDSIDILAEIISSKKVVFIGETHATVGPIIFLTNNLEKLQKAGVRYLFLEGGLPSISNAEDYRFIAFYPWSTARWKYEMQLLSDKLKDINSRLFESDRIKVIYPESTLFGEVFQGEEQALLNKRDEVASKKIIDILNSSSENEKAIVFYGADHGARRERPYTVDGINYFNWKPIGSYLDDYYGEMFYSINHIELSNYLFTRDLMGREWMDIPAIDTIIEPNHETKDNVLLEYSRRRDISLYDAYRVTNEPIYGRYYQYVVTDDNLRYMYKKLLYFALNTEKIINDDTNFRFGIKGQFLSYLYYLKMYYGRNFNYSLWSSESDLKTALFELGEYAFSSNKKPSLMVNNTSPNVFQMRKFHQLMHSSGIETLLLGVDVKIEDILIRNMVAANKIMKSDLWPTYWKSIGEIRKENYKTALEDLEKIISDELSSCLEVLPQVYERAALCAEKLENEIKAKRYLQIAQQLRKNFSYGIMSFRDVM